MAHVRKRQFQPSTNQPSITSFFNRIDPLNPPADFNPYDRKYVPSFSQPLPDPVQSQLVNMGMRIRKSVPEGYKTHKTLPPASSAPTYKPALVHADTAPASSAPTLYTKPNELMPMCGLHKIGGYSSQPTSSAPELNYSQSTISSSFSSLPSASTVAVESPHTPTNTRKRSYDEEIEDELDEIFSDEQDRGDEEIAEGLTSPKTKYPLSHSSMPELNKRSGFVRPGSRPKARMRARGDAASGQEGVKLFGSFGTDNDFEDGDVAFLAPMDCD